MQSHLEFAIVTPRNRDAFAGPVLLVPGIGDLDAVEKAWVDGLAARGVKVLDAARPGREYADALEPVFSRATGDGRVDPRPEAVRAGIEALVRPAMGNPAAEVEAPPYVAASIANAAGKPRVFLTNLNGIRPAHRVSPVPVPGIKVSFASAKATEIRVLPFMGRVTTVPAGRKGGRLSAVLPPLERGAVVWCQ
jgi:hypothetical protein